MNKHGHMWIGGGPNGPAEVDRGEVICWDCGQAEGEWWWYCPAHNVWECDACSYPGEGSRPYEEGRVGFRCVTGQRAPAAPDPLSSWWYWSSHGPGSGCLRRRPSGRYGGKARAVKAGPQVRPKGQP